MKSIESMKVLDRMDWIKTKKKESRILYPDYPVNPVKKEVLIRLHPCDPW